MAAKYRPQKSLKNQTVAASVMIYFAQNIYIRMLMKAIEQLQKTQKNTVKSAIKKNTRIKSLKLNIMSNHKEVLEQLLSDLKTNVTEPSNVIIEQFKILAEYDRNTAVVLARTILDALLNDAS